MRNVLVLGGTGWLGREIVSALLARGDAVTALARGESGDVPSGARIVRTDRRRSDAYSAVDTDWDEVIEISFDHSFVTAALATLASRATHWTLVSTISVYASNAGPGADETADLVEPVDLRDYGQVKAAIERATAATLRDRLLTVRPGLIVGPGDPSDRFGYWVGRMALAGTEPMLSMTTADRHSQVIDVRDLAGFVARSVGTGVANAVGTAFALDATLERAAMVADFTGKRVEAEDDWLAAHGVGYWAGPRSLPLWLPPEDGAMLTRNNAAYLAAGGTVRDLEATLTDILDDERWRGLERGRRAGLTRPDELELLAQRERRREPR